MWSSKVVVVVHRPTVGWSIDWSIGFLFLFLFIAIIHIWTSSSSYIPTKRAKQIKNSLFLRKFVVVVVVLTVIVMIMMIKIMIMVMVGIEQVYSSMYRCSVFIWWMYGAIVQWFLFNFFFVQQVCLLGCWPKDKRCPRRPKQKQKKS